MYEKHEMEVIIFDEHCAFCSETTSNGGSGDTAQDGPSAASMDW